MANTKTKPIAKPKHPDTLTIYEKPGDDSDATLAQAYLRPTVQAGCTVRAYNKGKDGSGPSLDPLIAELQTQVELVANGDLRRAEAMLFAQAHSLDAIFGNLARRALNQETLHHYQTYLQLAMKAQAQCRATLQTLVEVKFPRQTQFVRQQNVAVNQQVNNGEAAKVAPRAHEETTNQTNELLEALPNERLELDTQRAPSIPDSTLAAVDKVNRP